jgi:predicted naringenin-chalcone synthase
MRHYLEHAPPLALRAARQALDDAALRPDLVTDLVTVSCTGFAAPGVDVTLIRQLGLPEDVSRTHVGFMGCHGAFNALRVARGYVAADPAARVLVCAVELCSLHFAYGWKPLAIVANALFADGAGAVVLGAGDDGTSGWRLAASGSTLLPDSEEAMTWHIRDHGFEMTLSPRVPELIATHLRPWLEAWLGRQGVAMTDVAAWAVHPGGPRVVQAVSEALGIPGDAVADSLAVLCELGNMSSPTILFILQRMRQSRTAGPLVALGFGPGLTAEAMLLV